MSAPAEKPLGNAPSLSPAEYNKLVAAANLRDIRLVESSFAIAPDGLETRPELKLVHTCEIENAHADIADGLLVAIVAAAASAVIAGEDRGSETELVSARCRYLIVYNIVGNPTEAAVDTFAKRVARFAAYPYFRAHFAELASQAGLMLPPLPVIKERRLIPEVAQTPTPSLPQQPQKKRRSSASKSGTK